jgi:hypothetical protein
MNVHVLKSTLQTVLTCSLEIITSLPPNKPEIHANYFHSFENKMDTHNFRAIMVRHFNTSGFAWKRGLSLPKFPLLL